MGVVGGLKLEPDLELRSSGCFWRQLKDVFKKFELLEIHCYPELKQCVVAMCLIV